MPQNCTSDWSAVALLASQLAQMDILPQRWTWESLASATGFMSVMCGESGISQIKAGLGQGWSIPLIYLLPAPAPRFPQKSFLSTAVWTWWLQIFLPRQSRASVNIVNMAPCCVLLHFLFKCHAVFPFQSWIWIWIENRCVYPICEMGLDMTGI